VALLEVSSPSCCSSGNGFAVVVDTVVVVFGGVRLDADLAVELVLRVVVAVVGPRVVVGMVGTKLSSLAAVMLATWREL
jgi:hypothetical protein